MDLECLVPAFGAMSEPSAIRIPRLKMKSAVWKRHFAFDFEKHALDLYAWGGAVVDLILAALQ